MDKRRTWPAARPQWRASRAAGLLDEDELDEIERQLSGGHDFASRSSIVFTARGIRFSEATLRKYVQLGLLPRSVRVGRKGKHRGSCGIYPADVVRRVNQVSAMMAADLTIEEIQRSFARFKEDIERVEKGCASSSPDSSARPRARRSIPDRRAVDRTEIVAAKQAAGELVRRISGVEASLSCPRRCVGRGDRRRER